MMHPRPKVRRWLSVEQLENRLTPSAYGQQWLNPEHLTLSFPSDGTAVGSVNSNLLEFLNLRATQAGGEEEILRAFQTWAVTSKINIALVGEQGNNPLGSPGLIQGDARFGDIRVAGSTALTPEVVAVGAPFNWSLGTASGDVVFNTNQNIGINPSGVGNQYDLYSVALHEAGHVFGFPDETSDPTSVMFANYQGPLKGLSAGDIAALQAVYGAPTPDSFQNNGGNGTFAKAAPVALTANTVLSGDLTQMGQQEYFAVSVPAGQNLVVTLHTAGYSLLIPTLKVYNASGNLLKSANPNQPWIQDASVNFGGQPTTQTYYIQVASAATNVFGMGGFQLEVGKQNPPNPQQPSVNQDKTTNATLATATPLTYSASSVATYNYSYYGTMSDTSGSHYYQFVAPPMGSNTTEAMIVSVLSLQTGSSAAGVHVYDQNGNPQPFQYLTNGGLEYAIQVTGLVPNETYYVQTTHQSPSAQQNPGNYELCISFAAQGYTQAAAVVGSTLSQSNQTTTATMTLTQAGLLSLSLWANEGSSTVPVNVTMTVTNSTGQTLFTLTAIAGQPPVTLNYYLGAGTYNVTFLVSLGQGAPGGSSIPTVAFELAAGIFSDPQGAYFTAGSLTMSGGLTVTGPNNGGSPPYYY